MNRPRVSPRTATKRKHNAAGLGGIDSRFREEMLYDEAVGPRSPKLPPISAPRGGRGASREWEDPYHFVDVRVDAERETRRERLSHFGFDAGGLRPVGPNAFCNLWREAS